jgi:hypothetical protein
MRLYKNAILFKCGVSKDNNRYNDAGFKSIFPLSITTLERRSVRRAQLFFLLALSRDIYQATVELRDCYGLWGGTVTVLADGTAQIPGYLFKY